MPASSGTDAGTHRGALGGASWQLVVDGIAPRHAVNVVREDPVRAGLLYAGTERGVYVSFDDGDRRNNFV